MCPDVRRSNILDIWPLGVLMHIWPHGTRLIFIRQSKTHALKRRTGLLERKAPSPVTPTPSGPLESLLVISAFSFLRMVRASGILSRTDPKIGGRGFMSEYVGPKCSSAQSHKSRALFPLFEQEENIPSFLQRPVSALPHVVHLSAFLWQLRCCTLTWVSLLSDPWMGPSAFIA